MFRLFSSIRQNLFNENKTFKYLKYAVGEVLLIMIGIILALQFQNWNEARKERIEERDILRRISKEVKGNNDNLTIRREPLQSKAEALDRLRANFETQSFEDPKALLTDVLWGARYGWTHPKIQVFTFEEFQSSGKFSLVQNKELLDLIMGYYSTNEAFVDRADYRSSDMLHIAADIIPFDEGVAQRINNTLSDSQYESIAREVLNSDLYLHIVREQNRGAFLNNTWESIIEQGTLLLAAIEAELNQ